MGVFAAVASSLDGMSDTLERLFNFKVGHITRRLGPAENYLAFLHLPECEGSNPFPEAKTVEFRNVGFAYPNATKNAVSGLSLTIRDGGTVAVVGSNGAGKSTFTRLILGIYRPTEGAALLSREFGGTDLSGGQWQRLAIARGLYRRHNLIVLDEPTSAMDPLEETRVYERFAELSRDKTASSSPTDWVPRRLGTGFWSWMREGWWKREPTRN